MIAASLLCLALTVQREAGGEPLHVQRAVVHVIRNRTRQQKKPVCRIVRQKRQFQLLKKKPRPEIIRVAIAAWLQPDTTKGATHFHDPREMPGWAKNMTRTALFGKLRFYRVKK